MSLSQACHLIEDTVKAPQTCSLCLKATHWQKQAVAHPCAPAVQSRLLHAWMYACFIEQVAVREEVPDGLRGCEC